MVRDATNRTDLMRPSFYQSHFESRAKEAQFLVETAWDQLRDQMSGDAVQAGPKYPATFGGGFIGLVRVLRTPQEPQGIRTGFGAKWNGTRRSYFVRGYRYRTDLRLYQTLAETELPAEQVHSIREGATHVLSRLVNRMIRRFAWNVERKLD